MKLPEVIFIIDNEQSYEDHEMFFVNGTLSDEQIVTEAVLALDHKLLNVVTPLRKAGDISVENYIWKVVAGGKASDSILARCPIEMFERRTQGIINANGPPKDWPEWKHATIEKDRRLLAYRKTLAG